MTDEIHPYLVYRIADGRLECALWQLREGPRALAMFLSGDSATAYRDAAHPGEEWKVFRPAKENLWQLLKECYHAGICYAVLDPDGDKAQRIFDIKSILSAAAEEEG
jgi:hypothetical protein